VAGAAGAALAMGIVGALLAWAPLFDRWAPLALDRPLPEARWQPAARRALLVSVDGLAPRVLELSDAPTLSRLARQGARAREARSVVPSITLTAHTTLLSGLGPERHGVLWNRYQPWSAVAVPTVFGTCAARGLRCGLFAGKPKFAHFAEGEPGVERYRLGRDDGAVLGAAAAYTRERDPDLLVIHLAEVDLAGHAEGWGSPAQRDAVRRADRVLGEFLEAFRAASSRPFTLLLTADHGGRGTRHGSDHADDVAVPWILYGDGVAPGAALPDAGALDAAPTLLAILGLRAPAEWPGRARFPLAGR